MSTLQPSGINIKDLFNQYAPFHKYRQATRQVSYDVSDFVEKISQLPGCENTLFILTSDHGEGLENHQSVAMHKTHGFLLYESQLKVPLIFFNPKTPADKFKKKRVNTMVSLMDLAPTILDYAGIAQPDSFTGRSALGLMKDQDIESPQFFFAETSLRNADKASVYSNKWKFIENYDNWPGVNKYELQPAGIYENGKFTDQIEVKGELGREMQQILHSWQKKYKKEPSVSTSDEPIDKIKEQLKGLGYID